MFRRLVIITLFITLSLFAQTKKPNELGNSFWLSFEGGGNYYRGDFKNTDLEFFARGSLEYLFESHSKGLFGVKFSTGYGALIGKNSFPLLIGSPSRNSNSFLSYLIDSKIGLMYLLRYRSFYPYISVGAHQNVWFKTLDDQRNRVYDQNRDLTIGYYGELGFKINLSDGLTLNFVGIFSFPNSDEIDGYVSSKKDMYFSGLVGFSIYFASKKDSDKDGIVDKYDKCPETPSGTIVDKFGCPEIQSLDNDNDGVNDVIDKCPNTPKGISVDAKGCPTDEDKDGVPDYLDKCPNTLKDIVVDNKGCPIDTDGDGVYDSLDKCPNTPIDVTVDENGCPLDSDIDGVYDYLDQCSDTPPGTIVDSDGCPVESKKDELTVLILQSTKSFESGSARLTESAKNELKKFSEIMKKYPDAKWRIEGHTDSQGSFDFNKKLSQQRADAVKTYLIGMGFLPSNLIAEGMGEIYPIADNKTKEGREKNRRIIITKIK